MKSLNQYVLQQTDAHQLLLNECVLNLDNRTLTIICHEQSNVTAIREAISLLVEGLDSIADQVVVKLGRCTLYRCTVKVALRKYAFRLAALDEQLRQVGIISR